MSEVRLSEEQEQCIEAIRVDYELGEKQMSIMGPAGSGKSTIIPHLVEALGLNSDSDIAYLAPTGKASVVMRQKGVPGQTLHSFIYNSFYSNRYKKFLKTPKTLDQLEPYPQLIIIDEIAMCSVHDLEILERHEIPIIAFGDNAQLPPIRSEQNHYVTKPTFTLTQIHRQAEGSEIIQFSKTIRETGFYSRRYGEEGQVLSVARNNLNTAMLSWADQTLVSTNSAKDGINKIMREKMNFKKEYPEIGDKIICLNNNWDIMSKAGLPLTNGTIGFITNIEYKSLETFSPYAIVEIIPEYDEDDAFNFKMDLAPFMGMTPYNSRGKNIRVECDFAYAITIHKSQGSEWDKVLVVADSFFGDKAKMAYTAATRASEKLVWVQ